MRGFWRGKAGGRSAVSADFEHALTHEVLRSELIRVRALGSDGSDAVSLGEVAIKGYDRPMPVWQLG